MIRLPAGDRFLVPAHAIETPVLQVGCNRFLEPTLHRVSVFLVPEMAVLRIAKRGRIDVVEAQGKIATPSGFWNNQRLSSLTTRKNPDPTPLHSADAEFGSVEKIDGPNRPEGNCLRVIIG